MLSPSLEDYLEELYRLSLTTPSVRVTDLSNKLNVKLPSVTKALYRLNEQKYIRYKPYGDIELTDLGKEIGEYLVNRNKLLQEFLTLLCSKCDIEAEAEAMEHYLCDATIRAIEQFVTYVKERPEWYQQYLEFISLEQ